jgi:hypothetical protein
MREGGDSQRSSPSLGVLTHSALWWTPPSLRTLALCVWERSTYEPGEVSPLCGRGEQAVLSLPLPNRSTYELGERARLCRRLRDERARRDLPELAESDAVCRTARRTSLV